MFKVAPLQSLWLQYPHIALFCPQQSGLLGFITVCKLSTTRCRLLLRTGVCCQTSQGIAVPCEPVVSGYCAWQDSRLRGRLLTAWNSRLNSHWTSSRGWQTCIDHVPHPGTWEVAAFLLLLLQIPVLRRLSRVFIPSSISCGSMLSHCFLSSCLTRFWHGGG